MRKHNFNAGPAALPQEVLLRAQAELPDFHGAGMSLMEMSHRSREYEAVHQESKERLRQLLGIPESHHVLFLQGGASMQFAMVPMNFLSAGRVAGYVQTGNWSGKAMKEAATVGETRVIASSQASPLAAPDVRQMDLAPDLAYVHVTSNETIEGLRLTHFPEVSGVPLIADMSSDILSREIDVAKFDLIYAGAQKNLGPSGVTVVIVHDDMVRRGSTTIPAMMRYGTHVKSDSLYNTPPTFAIYLMGLVLEWAQEQGGLPGMILRGRRKADAIYQAIDGSDGFYTGLVARQDRSLMNITFGMDSESLEKEFLKEADERGFVGLKGHRELGHFRASLYNAVPEESCLALADFMADFRRRRG
ncbi:MAG: 3-phosphoserine/phosphohydroxythreonine transaminase [Firmicutes bacterium]|nr:3-phosphoserine/phosphohydroxythreonine transaminase [Bacillota bacterium]